MGIPYALIGDLIALALIALAFYWAESEGRIFLIVIVSLTYLLPRLFPSGALSLICLIARYLIGICCYIYLKFTGQIDI
jgi:hypothetical protein